MTASTPAQLPLPLPLLLLLLLVVVGAPICSPRFPTAADAAPSASPFSSTANSSSYCETIRRTALRLDRRCEQPLAADGRILPLLITGSGGSGTHAISYMFQAMGIDLLHEQLGAAGIVAWPLAASAYKTGVEWPWNSLRKSIAPGDRFLFVFHQVRHPLQAIAAMMAHANMSKWYAASVCGLLDLYDRVVAGQADSGGAVEGERGAEEGRDWGRESRSGEAGGPRSGRDQPRSTLALELAARSWLCWNTLLASYASWRYRVEDVTMPEICRRAQLDDDCDSLPDRLDVPAAWQFHRNRSHPVPTWGDLAAIDPHLAASVRSLALSFGYQPSVLGLDAMAER